MTQHSVKVKAPGSTSGSASNTLSDTGLARGQCAGSLKMAWAADKTRNNAD